MVGTTESSWVPPSGAPEVVRSALARFQEAVEGDGRVAAAFIGGSIASGSWDEHSDLDLYVIVDDDRYDEVFADRGSFVEAMGQVVLAEDFDGFGFDMFVFMLSNGVEGELGFGRRSGFTHVHGGHFEVLVDRDQVLADMTFPLQAPTAEERIPIVLRTVAWFWRHISLFATAVARARPWTAYGYLEFARRKALDLCWLLDAPDTWPGGYEKVEDYSSPERVSSLAKTLGDLDLQRQVDAAWALADFVAENGRAVCTTVNCEYPASLEDTVRHKLIKSDPRRAPIRDQ